MKRDPRSGPVPAPWATGAVARARGGVADEDGSVALTVVVDLEARSELERVPGRSPRRIMRSRSNPADDDAEALA